MKSSFGDRERFLAHLSTIGYTESQLVVDSSGSLTLPVPPPEPWGGRLPTLRTERGPGQEPDLDLGAVLGEGGMGRVLAAEQLALRREVAVKVLLRSGDERAGAQLLREALVAGRLEHPNIVPIYLVGRNPEGSPLLVMRKIEGVQWSKVLRDPALAPSFFARAATDPLAFHLSIFTRVCEAAHFAHARGVLHRDLKPDNVMLGAFGEVYLVDWGLAVALQDDGVLQPARAASSLAGTPRYMAPEMVACRADALGPHTDVFLLGAVLYEVVTGSAPFHGGSVALQLSRAFACTFEPLPASVPGELAAIVERAMARDPGARFPSVDDLRRAVLGFLEHRASWDLSRAADARASELEGLVSAPDRAEAEAARVQELFTECRYGYRQALEAWPGNAEATSGLQRAVERMVEHELLRGNPRGALAMLPQLPQPNAALAERVEQACARVAAEQERLSQLEAFREDVDPRLGVGERGRTVLAVGTFWLLVSLVAHTLHASGRWPFGYPEAFASIGLNLVVTLAGIAWIRRRERTNAAQRRLFLGGSLMGLGFVTHWGWSYLLDMSLTQGLVQFLWWVSGGWVLVAALFDWRALAPAASLALGAVAVALWPTEQIWIFGVSTWAGFTLLGSLWMRDGRSPREEPRPPDAS